MSLNRHIDKNFIEEFEDKIYWPYLFDIKKFNEDFIRKYSHKDSWYSISNNQNISEELIRDYNSKVDSYLTSLAEDSYNTNKGVR